METPEEQGNLTSRRSFLAKGAVAGAATFGVGRLVLEAAPAFAHAGGLTRGDAAILRFLAAAEIIETDLWQQYNELAGIQDGEVPGGSGNSAYTEAVAVLDEDMDQYIHDNTDDEINDLASYDGLAAAHPLGCAGEISDVVDGVLYLEQATFVTGEILHIDGGQAAGH